MVGVVDVSWLGAYAGIGSRRPLLSLMTFFGNRRRRHFALIACLPEARRPRAHRRPVPLMPRRSTASGNRQSGPDDPQSGWARLSPIVG